MRIIFTRSATPFSKLIRWASNSDCSHLALVFKSPAGGLMFESNLLGTHPKFFKTACKSMNVVSSFDVPIDEDLENKVWDSIVDKYDDKDYDYPGFFYFAWRALLLKFFNIPLPKSNIMGRTGAYLCVGLLEAIDSVLPRDLRDELKDIDVEMKFPNELRDIAMSYLKETRELEKIDE